MDLVHVNQSMNVIDLKQSLDLKCPSIDVFSKMRKLFGRLGYL